MPHLTRRATLASLAASAALPVRAEEKARLTFLLVNDVYEMGENAQHRGGFARLATVVKTERARALAEGRFFSFVHAGDTLSPSLMSGFDQGEHMIALFNDLGLDIFVPGNHEFDFGVDIYQKRMGEGRFAVLAANLRDAAGQSLAGHRHSLNFAHQGLKVAVVASAYDATPTASHSDDFTFAPTLETVAWEAKAAREHGADFVVEVVHADKKTGNDLMASHQVELILSGHNHDLHLDFDGRTALAESHQDANYVVVIDIDVAKTQSGLAWWPEFKVIDTANVEPDATVLAKVKTYQGALSKELDKPLATLASQLDSRSELVRMAECAIGNLVADAVRDAAQADVAITNGGGIRGNRTYVAGEVLTRRDILMELPFGNKVVRLPVTGAVLLAALEHGLSQVPQRSGGFPQVSGLKVKVSLDAAPGARIQSALVQGVPLDPTRIYTLATNDFVARGGDGYAMLTGLTSITPDSGAILIATAVMNYAQKLQTIDAKVEGRIVVV